MMTSPDRGEVWLVSLDRTTAAVPCLIVSTPALQQDRAVVTLIPYTTNLQGYYYEVDIGISFLEPGVFDIQTLTTVPQAQMIEKLGELDLAQLLKIEDVLLSWLGFETVNPDEA